MTTTTMENGLLGYKRVGDRGSRVTTPIATRRMSQPPPSTPHLFLCLSTSGAHALGY